eukprot:14175052-Alexandrium_andersonii.AAC.1
MSLRPRPSAPVQGCAPATNAGHGLALSVHAHSQTHSVASVAYAKHSHLRGWPLSAHSEWRP